MREGFQILDRDNDGLVNREDVIDMLSQLGQPASASDIAPFFPPGAPQTLPLPTFLATLSSLLEPLSQQTELLNAFAAFDDHDSGEIDVGELRDALLNTAPEGGEKGVSGREVDEVLGGFVGRRAFGKENLGAKIGGGSGGRGEVFRYREWVGGVMGGGEEKEGEK
jgi:Ca2+-binding EF-hand superfamily protein